MGTERVCGPAAGPAGVTAGGSFGHDFVQDPPPVAGPGKGTTMTGADAVRHA